MTTTIVTTTITITVPPLPAADGLQPGAAAGPDQRDQGPLDGV